MLKPTNIEMYFKISISRNFSHIPRKITNDEIIFQFQINSSKLMAAPPPFIALKI